LALKDTTGYFARDCQKENNIKAAFQLMKEFEYWPVRLLFGIEDRSVTSPVVKNTIFQAFVEVKAQATDLSPLERIGHLSKSKN